MCCILPEADGGDSFGGVGLRNLSIFNVGDQPGWIPFAAQALAVRWMEPSGWMGSPARIRSRSVERASSLSDTA